MACVMELLLTWDDKRRESRRRSRSARRPSPQYALNRRQGTAPGRHRWFWTAGVLSNTHTRHNKNSAAVAGSRELATSKAFVADHRGRKLPAAGLAGRPRDVVQIRAAHAHDRDVADTASLSRAGPG